MFLQVNDIGLWTAYRAFLASTSTKPPNDAAKPCVLIRLFVMKVWQLPVMAVNIVSVLGNVIKSSQYQPLLSIACQ